MKKPQFFIDSYTLGQFTAFCLTSNWALAQHEILVQSQHFFSFFEKRFPDGKVSSCLRDENPIKNIRNFFSHTIAEPIDKLEEEHIETLGRIVKNCLIEILFVRKVNLEKGVEELLKKCHENDNELERLFNFEHFPLGQPEIAFLLSPFLTRSQVSFLIGKIYFGKSSRQSDKEGNMLDTPATVAKKEILKTLSHSDNIVLRSSEGGNDSWLSSKHEQGFAIWQLLEKCYEENEKDEKDKKADEFPVDLDSYFMRQLLLFVENNDVLPEFSFARTETEIDKEGGISQKISFEADTGRPFAIRYNTVGICLEGLEGRKIEGRIGLQSLKYIVCAHLLGKGEKLSEWMKGWYLENEGYPQRRIVRSGSSETLKKRVSSRLEYLKKLNEKPPKNLQEQIRFVCRFINLACKNGTGKSLHKEDYKKLQENVRFYSKEVLRGYLQDLKVLDVSGIQLGRKDKEMLRHLIKDDTIQCLYKTLSKNYGDWIVGCEERLHELSDNDLEQLAGRIQLRKKVRKPGNPPSIGIDSLSIKREVFSEKQGKQLSFFNLTRELQFTLKLPEAIPGGGRENKQEREKWARRQLLFAMAQKSVRDLSGADVKIKKPEKKEEFPKLSTIPVRIKTGNHHITLNFSKSWRNMAHYPKVEKLIDVYLGRHKTVPLFSADEKDDGVSIEAALREMHKERFFLIQSLLKWEKDFVEENSFEPNSSGYVKFEEIANKAGLDNIISLRNKAFHDDIGDRRFSSVPSPIKEEYKKLSEQAENRRQSQKKRQNKRNRKD